MSKVLNPHISSLSNPSDTRSEIIGEFFKKARIHSKLGLVDVAQNLEISVSRLENIENGHSSIALDEIYAMANFYQIAPDDILELIHKVYL